MPVCWSELDDRALTAQPKSRASALTWASPRSPFPEMNLESEKPPRIRARPGPVARIPCRCKGALRGSGRRPYSRTSDVPCRGWGRERTERAYRPAIVARILIVATEGGQGLNFQEKTSNWEGDPPGELTVPQTDTGEQVEYTKARRENHVEGTRQNDPVTSGEGVLSPQKRGKAAQVRG